MKIYLFYPEQIYDFTLPKEIEGSYGFDADKNETAKLINIEAREGKWVIYSIEGVNLVGNNQIIESIPLQNNSFYVINRNNQNYLIYVEDITKNKFDTYSYSGLNMIIGNTTTSNIKYACPYIGQNEVKIYKTDTGIILEQMQMLAYKNSKAVRETRSIIQVGDIINIFGFKIMILNNLILMNNPGEKVQITNTNCGINHYIIPEDELPKNIQIIDRDLYEKKDYFSKSPRIRRIIETKEINLSPPPQKQSDMGMPLILTIGPILTMGVMSMATVIQLSTRLASGEANIKDSWPQMVTAGAMLISMILWPIITNRYNKKMNEEEVSRKRFAIKNNLSIINYNINDIIQSLDELSNTFRQIILIDDNDIFESKISEIKKELYDVTTNNEIK